MWTARDRGTAPFAGARSDRLPRCSSRSRTLGQACTVHRMSRGRGQDVAALLLAACLHLGRNAVASDERSKRGREAHRSGLWAHSAIRSWSRYFADPIDGAAEYHSPNHQHSFTIHLCLIVWAEIRLRLNSCRIMCGDVSVLCTSFSMIASAVLWHRSVCKHPQSSSSPPLRKSWFPVHRKVSTRLRRCSSLCFVFLSPSLFSRAAL